MNTIVVLLAVLAVFITIGILLLIKRLKKHTAIYVCET